MKGVLRGRYKAPRGHCRGTMKQKPRGTRRALAMLEVTLKPSTRASKVVGHSVATA